MRRGDHNRRKRCLMAAATCPKCKSRIAVIPGEQPVCPNCGQRFKIPEHKPEPVAVAANGPDEMLPPPIQARRLSISPQPSHFADRPAESPEMPVESPSPNAYKLPREQFKPREYPAVRVIIAAFYVLAILVLGSFMLSLAVIGYLIWGKDGQSAVANIPFEINLSSGVVAFAVSVGFHGFLLVVFTACAELIRVWLDIQQNTQEAAFYAKSRS